MSTRRRSVLKAAGSLTILAAAGGVWRCVDAGVFGAGSGPAFAPWDDWRAGMNDGPLALVRAAILAASPQNSQPWRFRVSPTRIELHADPLRSLGASDPFLREMHLALGCALENMLLAARAQGFAAEVELAAGRIDGSVPPAPVVVLSLRRAEPVYTPLATAIPLRHTNRGPYDMGRSLSPETLSAIDALVPDIDGVRLVLFTDTEQRAAFGAEVLGAAEAILGDAVMLAAQDVWFRGEWSAVQAERDGLIPDAAGIPGLETAILKFLPRAESGVRGDRWLRQLREVQVPATPAFGLIAVRDLYDRAQALRAGRAWQRLHLWAASRGLALQPVNAPLERVDRERQLGVEPVTSRRLAGFTGDPAWQPTFAFRAGYPLQPAAASPRRPVEWVLLGA